MSSHSKWNTEIAVQHLFARATMPKVAVSDGRELFTQANARSVIPHFTGAALNHHFSLVMWKSACAVHIKRGCGRLGCISHSVRKQRHLLLGHALQQVFSHLMLFITKPRGIFPKAKCGSVCDSKQPTVHATLLLLNVVNKTLHLFLASHDQ